MNSIRRAITAERKRLFTLSPISTLQQQHASSSSTIRSTSRNLKTSKTRAPEVRSQPAATPAPQPSTACYDAVRKESASWPKPSEIPWQAKVVNSVNLIGQVKIPIQFETSADGTNWAGTVISQDDGSESSASLPSFWIPVIFEGDLAHIAACHLKEKDRVHIAGHLSMDVPPFKLSEVQANVQVMVHSINFIEGSPQSKKTFTTYEVDKRTTKNSEISEKNISPQQPLQELASKSNQLGVFAKRSSTGVAFAQEKDGHLHTVAESSEPLHSDRKVNKQSVHASWRDLLANSKEWLDNRENKRKGLVKANYPDFKHKDTSVGLWLDSAPVEVLQGLGRLEFHGLPSTHKNEISENNISPQQPLQELASKSNQLGVFAKRSSTGVAFAQENDGHLHISEPLHSDRKVNKQSVHASWRDLLANSKEWLDNRENKRKGLVKANYPDFKHKDTGVGLWLDSAPVEVLQGLGRLEFHGLPSTRKNDGDPWKHLAENPNEWWDKRTDKRNQKAPDFRHKDSGKPLWLGDAPAWVLSSLPPLKAKTLVDEKKSGRIQDDVSCAAFPF